MWLQHYQEFTHTLEQLIFFLSALMHVLFAGGVAKDCGRLSQRGLHPILVSPSTWAFTTLLGGVWVAGLYWLLHHSTLTRCFPIQTDTKETS
jgi:hypothetical protein